MEEKKLNESIISIRVKLQNSNIKKSGKNKFAGFDYYELKDFLPKLNELMLEEKVNDRFYIKDDYAILELQKGDEINAYTIPFVLFETPTSKKYDKDLDEYVKVKTMQDIQYLGALNTYYKRYLYLNAFGITDGEIIDSMNNDEIETKQEKNVEKKKIVKATASQIEAMKKLYSEEELQKALSLVKREKLEDMTVYEASNLISKRAKKEEVKENEWFSGNNNRQ